MLKLKFEKWYFAVKATCNFQPHKLTSSQGLAGVTSTFAFGLMWETLAKSVYPEKKAYGELHLVPGMCPIKMRLMFLTAYILELFLHVFWLVGSLWLLSREMNFWLFSSQSWKDIKTILKTISDSTLLTGKYISPVSNYILPLRFFLYHVF